MTATSSEEIVGKEEKEETYYKRIIENGGKLVKLVAEIPMAKLPHKTYKIVQSADGVLYCSCPAWAFQKKAPKDRECKHTRAVLAGSAIASSGISFEEAEEAPALPKETITTTKIKSITGKTKMTSKTSLIGLEYEEKVLESVMKCGLSALLIGETGTGKTSLAKEIAKTLGKEVVRVNLDGGMTPDELVGRIMLKGSETYFEKGIVPKAMEKGACLILDEVNACLPDTLFVLHALLEKPSRLLIPETGEEITPSEGFCVIATMNPSHDYAGTKGLNPAFYSRFGVTLRFKSVKGENLCMALASHVSTAPANHVAEVAWIIEEIEKHRQEEKINTRVSIREGISALLLAEDGLTLDEAIDVSIISRLEKHEIGELSKSCGGRVKVKKEIATSVDDLLRKANEAGKLGCEIADLKNKLTKFEKLHEVMKTISSLKLEESKS